MTYQSFRGADLQEALSAVKATLGPNAMIEGTRRVTNGRGGALGQQYVEVTAAPPQGLKWPFASREARPIELPLRERAAMMPPGGEQRSLRTKSKYGTVLGMDGTEVERELNSLRAMLEELNQQRPPRERALTLLHAKGIEGALARELANGAAKSAKKGKAPLNEFLRGRLAERITVSGSLMQSAHRTLIACMGPTGAGKTTTLAKLAARARLDLGRSVGVISLDTFRVGAVEQWQRYAALMGIPFQVASDRGSFRRALAEITADIVLVDTAGRSTPTSSWILPDCLSGTTEDLAKHALLVLPAWLRASDVTRTSGLYEVPAPTEVVITKLDETLEAGGVMHAALPSNIPIAYLCNGPRVPEDIREASVEAVVDAVLPTEA
ncbi:MAG TPA: flagellar biosynthesis protein FlhF [Polyangiaceae bacterium]|nr:flagellar biosynthesis protein FlhF [Polyangiaceae bacterium]